MITEELKKLYTAYTGHEPDSIEEMPASGSNRRYFRLKGTPNLIGVSGESVEENRAFLYMAEHFRRQGLPVPQVFIKSDETYITFRKTWAIRCSSTLLKRTQDQRLW